MAHISACCPGENQINIHNTHSTSSYHTTIEEKKILDEKRVKYKGKRELSCGTE